MKCTRSICVWTGRRPKRKKITTSLIAHYVFVWCVLDCLSHWRLHCWAAEGEPWGIGNYRGIMNYGAPSRFTEITVWWMSCLLPSPSPQRRDNRGLTAPNGRHHLPPSHRSCQGGDTAAASPDALTGRKGGWRLDTRYTLSAAEKKGPRRAVEAGRGRNGWLRAEEKKKEIKEKGDGGRGWADGSRHFRNEPGEKSIYSRACRCEC